MPIEIREVVTEVVVRGADEPPTSGPTSTVEAQGAGALREQIVRQAVERVMDILRREWDR